MSRDRYSKYSNAISAALPKGIQVVNRWHLLKNLCEGLHKLVERNYQYLKYARRNELLKLQRASKTQVLRKQKAAAKLLTNEHHRQYQFRQIKVLLRKQEQLQPQEYKLVNTLCKQCPKIKTAYHLAREFKKMMERKKGRYLGRWIGKVVDCGIEELKSFAKGLLSDIEAIKNAFNMPWSNGQVERQINKLKTIKRQMYGRASFPLLRKRLLLDSSVVGK